MAARYKKERKTKLTDVDFESFGLIADLAIPRGTLNKVIKRLADGGLVERRGSKKTGGYYVTARSLA